MTTLNRRAFLGVTPIAVGAGLQTFAAFNTSRGSGRLIAPLGAGGYGGLRAAKARNTGEEILTLPEGFEYNVIGKTGTKMSDGNPTPAAHDGMAAFKVNDELRLVRNHEINNGAGRDGAAFGDAALAYDAKAGGGTTTLIINLRRARSSRISSASTARYKTARAARRHGGPGSVAKRRRSARIWVKTRVAVNAAALRKSTVTALKSWPAPTAL